MGIYVTLFHVDTRRALHEHVESTKPSSLGERTEYDVVIA